MCSTALKRYGLLLLLCAHMLSCADAGVKPRRGTPGREQPGPGLLRRGSRQVTRPDSALEGQDESPPAAASEPRLSKASGKLRHRGGAAVAGHGIFNSDTFGCSGIQSRSCRAPAECAGCLGLYTCNLSKGKCDLKGVSRKTGGFLQSLQKT